MASPPWLFICLAAAALLLVHHSNTHIGLLDERERRHAEEVLRLRELVTRAESRAEAVAPVGSREPDAAAGGAAAEAATTADGARCACAAAGGAAPRAAERKAFLAVGLPTVPRTGEADYLLQTLASFAKELPRDARDPRGRGVRSGQSFASAARRAGARTNGRTDGRRWSLRAGPTARSSSSSSTSTARATGDSTRQRGSTAWVRPRARPAASEPAGPGQLKMR